jgi:hypothetical protein
MSHHLKKEHEKYATKYKDFSPDEQKYFEKELKRLALEIHAFRYGRDADINKTRVRNYKRTLRIRISNGEYVPGYKTYS